MPHSSGRPSGDTPFHQGDALELNPRYVDTIVRCWQAFTGGNAIQELTSRTFNDIEQEHHGQAD